MRRCRTMTVDPIFVGMQIGTALQGIVSRNADPLESLVVSITQFHAGDAINVIPQSAKLIGTVRSLKQRTARSCDDAICAGRRRALPAALGGSGESISR